MFQPFNLAVGFAFCLFIGCTSGTLRELEDSLTAERSARSEAIDSVKEHEAKNASLQAANTNLAEQLAIQTKAHAKAKASLEIAIARGNAATKEKEKLALELERAKADADKESGDPDTPKSGQRKPPRQAKTKDGVESTTGPPGQGRIARTGFSLSLDQESIRDAMLSNRATTLGLIRNSADDFGVKQNGKQTPHSTKRYECFGEVAESV